MYEGDLNLVENDELNKYIINQMKIRRYSSDGLTDSHVTDCSNLGFHCYLISGLKCKHSFDNEYDNINIIISWNQLFNKNCSYYFGDVFKYILGNTSFGESLN
jgi:hypothetical protein